MDSQNIHAIFSQLKSINENVGKIAGGFNNPWTIWVPILTTLFLGFIAIFQDKVRYWFYKPKLNVSVKEPAGISTSGYIQQYKFFFEIKNTGKSTLEDAEALITDIWELNEGEKQLNPMPFNLTWSQKGGTTIPKIPSNTYKFFDFGEISSPPPPPSSLIAFKFNANGVNLKSGEHKIKEYKIKIEFSANNVKSQIKIYKLGIKNKWVDDVNDIKQMISIDEIEY